MICDKVKNTEIFGSYEINYYIGNTQNLLNKGQREDENKKEEINIKEKRPKITKNKSPIIEDDNSDAGFSDGCLFSGKQEKQQQKVNKAPDYGDFAAEDENDMLNVPAFFRRKK